MDEEDEEEGLLDDAALILETADIENAARKWHDLFMRGFEADLAKLREQALESETDLRVIRAENASKQKRVKGRFSKYE